MSLISELKEIISEIADISKHIRSACESAKQIIETGIEIEEMLVARRKNRRWMHALERFARITDRRTGMWVIIQDEEVHWPRVSRLADEISNSIDDLLGDGFEEIMERDSNGAQKLAYLYRLKEVLRRLGDTAENIEEGEHTEAEELIHGLNRQLSAVCDLLYWPIQYREPWRAIESPSDED